VSCRHWRPGDCPRRTCVNGGCPQPHNGAVPTTNPIFTDLLKERVAQAQTQQAALVMAIEDIRVTRSLTYADDEHDPEGSTLSLDQARDAALLDQTERTLAELAAAQQRLAAGAYGICELCGREIPTERMIARPEARLCVPCSERAAAGRPG